MTQGGTETGPATGDRDTSTGTPDQPTVPTQLTGSEQRRGSVLGYLSEVEPLMEPTGGYPIVLPRQSDRSAGGSAGTRAPGSTAPPADPATPAGPGPTVYSGSLVGADARPRRRQWILVVVLIAIIVLLAAALLAVQHRQRTGPVSLPLPAGVNSVRPSPSAPAVVPSQPEVSGTGASGGTVPGGVASTSPQPSGAQPSGSVDPSVSPTTESGPPVPLHARYATVTNTGPLGITGYRGRVTVENPGSRPANGWIVTIVLPSDQSLASADGAGYSVRGDTVTFGPTDATSGVPAGGSVDFTFQVNGILSGPPTGCAINDQPCD